MEKGVFISIKCFRCQARCKENFQTPARMRFMKSLQEKFRNGEVESPNKLEEARWSRRAGDTAQRVKA